MQPGKSQTLQPPWNPVVTGRLGQIHLGSPQVKFKTRPCRQVHAPLAPQHSAKQGALDIAEPQHLGRVGPHLETGTQWTEFLAKDRSLIQGYLSVRVFHAMAIETSLAHHLPIQVPGLYSRNQAGSRHLQLAIPIDLRPCPSTLARRVHCHISSQNYRVAQLNRLQHATGCSRHGSQQRGLQNQRIGADALQSRPVPPRRPQEYIAFPKGDLAFSMPQSHIPHHDLVGCVTASSRDILDPARKQTRCHGCLAQCHLHLQFGGRHQFLHHIRIKTQSFRQAKHLGSLQQHIALWNAWRGQGSPEFIIHRQLFTA